MRDRPLSPHLSIYRFGYTLSTSIANRFTGVALSVGLLLLVGWLMAAANGPAAYARAATFFAHALLKLVYAVLLLAWAYHTVNGIRHLVWDTGRGLERHQARRSAWLVTILAVLIALVLGFFLFFGAEEAR